MATLSGLPAVEATEASIAFDKSQFDLATLSFPLVPKTLKMGLMPQEKRIESVAVKRPIAVVGADQLSVGWLQVNAEYLQSIGAQVIVVSAPSVSSFDSLIRRFPKLSMIPMQGDTALADELSLNIYPVLIDPSKGVVRQ